jgi:hypothetical protein
MIITLFTSSAKFDWNSKNMRGLSPLLTLSTGVQSEETENGITIKLVVSCLLWR